MRLVAPLGVLLAGCTSFQDPDIVVDLRVLAMQASVPEQVIDVDFTAAPNPADVLAQLVPSTVCALVGDPARARGIRWAMTMCAPTDDERCDPAHPIIDVGSGAIADPDDSDPEPTLCATVQPDADLIAVLEDALEQDTLDGFSGLDYSISLRVGGVGDDPSIDQYAEKTLQVAARVPANRLANNNPYLSGVMATPFNPDGTLGAPVPLPLGRCVDQTAPLTAVPTQVVRFTPVEPPGVREVYVVPTLSGGSETFAESLTYQWLAGDGSFSAGSTGGPPDLVGNPAVLFTDWAAPDNGEIGEAVPIWIVQRDERYGEQWYESCVVVGAP